MTLRERETWLDWRENVKRYQHCSWPVRLWRCRRLLVVPLRAAWLWLWWRWFLSRQNLPPDRDQSYLTKFPTCWKLARSEANSRMARYVTSAELFARLRERRKSA